MSYKTSYGERLLSQEYTSENIDWTRVDFEDNQECLDLIEKVHLDCISLPKCRKCIVLKSPPLRCQLVVLVPLKSAGTVLYELLVYWTRPSFYESWYHVGLKAATKLTILGDICCAEAIRIDFITR